MNLNQSETYYRLAKELDDTFKDVDKYKSIYGISREQAEMETSLYMELKDKAACGVKTARTHIINQYTKLLSSYLGFNSEETANSLINFEDMQANHVQILFEMLLDLYDVSEILEKYDLEVSITEEQIRNIAKQEESVMKKHYTGLTSKLKLIATIVYASEYGQDCIDTLQYHNINEIGIINKDYIYIVYKSGKIHLEFLNFDDQSVILNIQKKTTQNSAANYDENNPTLVTSKYNSSRITVAGYDVTPDDDLYYNERIFNLKNITLEQMRDTYQTINPLIYDFLLLNQKGRGSYIVSGSDMGVGKSTFLNAMIEKVPDRWGIGIFDTQNELQSKKKYPWKNILTVIETVSRSTPELFAYLLKTARDILIVGEITMPAEVGEMINAVLRLNAGMGGTLHSLSPFEVVTNLRNLLMRTEIYNDAGLAEGDIARGLDIIIHLGRHPENARRIVVENIAEVVYVEQNHFVEPLITGEYRDKMNNILNLVQLALHKYLYGKNYRYNEIFRYDPENDRWRAVNLPTGAYFKKISKYVSPEEVRIFKDLFGKSREEEDFC